MKPIDVEYLDVCRDELGYDEHVSKHFPEDLAVIIAYSDAKHHSECRVKLLELLEKQNANTSTNSFVFEELLK